MLVILFNEILFHQMYNSNVLGSLICQHFSDLLYPPALIPLIKVYLNYYFCYYVLVIHPKCLLRLIAPHILFVFLSRYMDVC